MKGEKDKITNNKNNEAVCKELTISVQTKASMGEIQSIVVNGEDNSLYVFTLTKAYILNLPLKDSIEDSLRTEVSLPNNPAPLQMSFLVPKSLIYLDNTDHLYFKLDLFDSNPPVKVKQDAITNGTILDKQNGGTSRDWVIIRGLDDYSGYLYRIVNWTSLLSESQVNTNSEVLLGIDSRFDQAMVYNNSIAFVEKLNSSNNTKGKFMFYKTDLGGFVRSILYDISDLGIKTDSGLLSLFYRSDPTSALELFHYESKTNNLIRSTINVSDLNMNCDPDDILVRLLPSSHTSYFLTLPKQNAITELDRQDPSTIIYIAHAIKWDNKINGYGWAAWVILGIVLLIFLACLIRNILNYSEDQELLKEITETMYENATTAFSSKDGSRRGSGPGSPLYNTVTLKYYEKQGKEQGLNEEKEGKVYNKDIQQNEDVFNINSLED